MTSFITITNNNYNCGSCKKKYIRQPSVMEAMFKQKACKVDNPNKILTYTPTHEMAGSAKINYHTCPANLKDNYSVELIGIYSMFEKGIMPYSGGLMDQPAKFVEVMDLVHNLRSEHQKEQEKKTEKYRR